MGSRSDIQAGAAFVTLSVKNQLTGGLRVALSHIKDFGAAAAVAATAFGATVATTMVAALKHFADTGSALNDMSERTGLAASTLAKLAYAADLSGASIEDVETAIKKSQKEGKDFFEIADAIAAVEDPAKRTQMALEAWGKSGTKLLPMVNSLRETMSEAIAPSDESVRIADALGDEWSKLMHTLKAGVYEVGAALAPMVIPAIQAVTAGMRDMVGSIQTNIKALFGSIGDALIGGEFLLAWEIAMKEMQLACQLAVTGIARMVGGVLGDALGTIGTKVIKGDLAGAWDVVVKGMAAAWDVLVVGIVTAMQQAVQQMRTMLIGLAALSTKPVSALMRAQAWMYDVDASMKEATIASGKGKIPEYFQKQVKESRDKASTLRTTAGMVDRGALVGGTVAATAPLGAIDSALDKVKGELSKRAAASLGEVLSEVADGAGEAGAEVMKLTLELAELKAKAAAAREAALAKFAAPPPVAELPSVTGKTFASFSAAALTSGGVGGRVQQVKDPDMLKKMDVMIKRLERLDAAMFVA